MEAQVKANRPKRPLVQLNVDDDLLTAIDRAAKRERMTRTAWLTQAALAHLPVDIAEEIERP
jgi:hypothetical protein